MTPYSVALDIVPGVSAATVAIFVHQLETLVNVVPGLMRVETKPYDVVNRIQKYTLYFETHQQMMNHTFHPAYQPVRALLRTLCSHSSAASVNIHPVRWS